MLTVQSVFTESTYSGQEPFVDSTSTYGQIGADILPPERNKLIDAIDYLSILDDGWNGHDAIKPTKSSIVRSKGFIQILWGKVYPATVSPDGEGGISFKWKNQQATLIITVDSAVIHLSHVYAKGVDKEDVFYDAIPFDGAIIPTKISAEIPERPKST